jgi:hypothetical protein
MTQHYVSVALTTCEVCQDADAIPTLTVCQPCLLARVTETAAAHAVVTSTRCEWCSKPTKGQLLCSGCTKMRVWESRYRPTRNVGWTIVVDGRCANVEAPPARERIPIRAIEPPALRVDSRAVSACSICGHFVTLHDEGGLCWHADAEGQADCECTKGKAKEARTA